MAKQKNANDVIREQATAPKTKVIFLGPPEGVTDLFFLIETEDGERTWLNYGVEDLLMEERSGYPASIEQLVQVLNKEGITEFEWIQAMVFDRKRAGSVDQDTET